jgi:hypothetical protein
MTNPFAMMTLHALHIFNTIHKTTALPKIVIYTAVGTTLAATIIYKSMKHFLSYKKRRNRTPPELPFEDKYFKEYDEWVSNTTTTNTAATATESNEEHKKECLENMYYATVRETINDFYGDIIMCYDHTTFSFAYYARTANIPYRYLETISRKYMIETNAPREIHVDIRSEYQKAKDRKNAPPVNTIVTTATEQTTAPAPAPPTEVYVKLKSYNNASNLKIHTTTNDEKANKFADSTKHDDGTATSTATTSTATTTPTTGTNIIIREKANRYSYRGKIDEFAEHHKTFLANRRSAAAPDSAPDSAADSAAATPAPVGYAEFKKQQMRKSAL